jgi:hypothetical protein
MPRRKRISHQRLTVVLPRMTHSSRIPPPRLLLSAVTPRRKWHACSQRKQQLNAHHPTPTETYIQRHTRGSRAALTSELPGCPASTGRCRIVGWCTRPDTCRTVTHEQPSGHHDMPRCSRIQPVARHTTSSQRISRCQSSEPHKAAIP